MLRPKTSDQLGREIFWSDNFFCMTGGDIGTGSGSLLVSLQRVMGAIGGLQIINQ